jgi:hypothetical protein
VNVFLIKCNILEFCVHMLVIIKLIYCTKCTVKRLKFLVNISLKVTSYDDVDLLITKVAVSVRNEDALCCV